MESIDIRNERAYEYSRRARHDQRCKRRRRILTLQWASVAALIFFGITVLYLLSLAEVF